MPLHPNRARRISAIAQRWLSVKKRCSVENVDCHSEAKPKNLISWAIRRFFTPLRSVQNDSFCGFSTEQKKAEEKSLRKERRATLFMQAKKTSAYF